MDGKDVLRKLRILTRTPVIVLSARDRESEKIAALDFGADDYVEKPFAMGELLARMRTALRHSQDAALESECIVVGGLVVNVSKRIVTGEIDAQGIRSSRLSRATRGPAVDAP